jgi:hypothetical protein
VSTPFVFPPLPIDVNAYSYYMANLNSWTANPDHTERFPEPKPWLEGTTRREARNAAA